MKMLLVPIPLFNKDMGVDYYCFRFLKDGNIFLSLQAHSLDASVMPPMLHVIKKAGLEALTTGKPLFVPISYVSLLADLENQCNETPSDIIFVIDNQTPVEKTFTERIKQLKALGFRFACHSKMDLEEHLPLIRLCDFMFVSAKGAELRRIRNYLNTFTENLIPISSDITTAEDFAAARSDGFELYEGPFYRLPLSKGQNKVSPLKINYINLLNIARNQDFDISKVARTVQQDAALAISLLRMVNSLGLSSRIESIEYASALLGEKELRKWITAVVADMLSADKPNEITKLTLIRAKFAETIAPKFELASQSQNLFLMGLFSALDLILDMPMERALNIVQVPDSIRHALLHKTGEFYPVLELLLWYETADWINTSRSLIINKLEGSDVFGAYLESLCWYNTLIAPLSEPEEMPQGG